MCIPIFAGAFQISGAIVDEAAFFRGNLRRLERQTIDIALGLAQADEAGTDEQAKDLPQSELIHPDSNSVHAIRC